MSSFDYTAIAKIISDELGYHLFVDYGTIEAKDEPYRKINEIITPVIEDGTMDKWLVEHSELASALN